MRYWGCCEILFLSLRAKAKQSLTHYETIPILRWLRFLLRQCFGGQATRNYCVCIKLLHAVLIICFILCPVNISLAENDNSQFTQVIVGQPLTPSASPDIQGNVSLDLRNIEVVDALKFLAMKVNMNIIVTKNVTGRITLMVENVPVKDIFDIMLRSNELAYAKEGNIYNVMTEDEYKLLFGKRFSDGRKVKIFNIQYAIPDQVFTLFDTLKSEIGRVLIEPESGTALILDTPERWIGKSVDEISAMRKLKLALLLGTPVLSSYESPKFLVYLLFPAEIFAL